MAVDADPSDPDIDTGAVRPLGEQFQVGFNITAAGQPWGGYYLVVDHAGLTFIPTDDVEGNTVLESWHYTGLGWVSLLGIVQIPPGFPDRLQGEAAKNVGTTTATGQAVVATFECDAPGVVNLHLVTSTEATIYTTTRGPDPGFSILTDLADATITCSDGAYVGGIAELPAMAGAAPQEASAPGGDSDWSTAGYVALAGGLVVAAFAVAVGASYLVRRRVR